MRQLNNDERELTEKGIKRMEVELKELKENLEYNKDLKSKEKFLRNFDDVWRDRLRKRKDKEDEKTLKQMKAIIDEKEKTVKQMNKHLTEGVEKKIPHGVG